MGSPPNAVEIGPIRPEELDRMLELMCDAFEMPYEAARPIFYADPYFDITKKWGLRVEGALVSCLTFVEVETWVGERTLPLVGVAGVATQKERRNRGYAGALLQEALRHLRRNRVGLCALVPAASAYYEKFGWAIAGTAQQVRLSRKALPHTPKTGSVEAVQEKDIPHLCALYDACTRGKTLRLLRDEKRWRHLLHYIPIARIFCTVRGEPEGYLLGRIQPGALQSLTPYATNGATLEILEKEAVSCTANEALIYSVKEMNAVEYVEITCPESELAGYGLNRDPATTNQAQASTLSAQMTRIVDAETLCAQLAAGWGGWRGNVELVIEDPFAPGGEDRIRILGVDSGRPRILRVAAGAAESEATGRGGVQVWSQLAVGAIGVDQAIAQGRLRLSQPEVAESIAMLFPSREPFLPLPDRF